MAMLCARAIQGVCSSCIGVSGMCLVAETFRGGSGDSGRAGAMSILLGGSALGVLVGYPVGGLLYEFVGKTAPFLLIGSMIFITIGKLIFCSVNRLLKSPYKLLSLIKWQQFSN